MKKIILTHLLLWIVIAAVFTYFSEAITKSIFSGFDDVSIFLGVVITGNVLILVILALSLIVIFVRRKRRGIKHLS